MKKPTIACVWLSGVLVATFAMAQSVAPDNAKSNQSDTSNKTATADRQANNPTDLDLTKRIRQSVMADKSLSTYAHNVKIVTINGNVTLNGVVRSKEEKGRGREQSGRHRRQGQGNGSTESRGKQVVRS